MTWQRHEHPQTDWEKFTGHRGQRALGTRADARQARRRGHAAGRVGKWTPGAKRKLRK